VDIGTPEGHMSFHSSGSRLDFKGYQAVYEVRSKIIIILYLLLKLSMDFRLDIIYSSVIFAQSFHCCTRVS